MKLLTRLTAISLFAIATLLITTTSAIAQSEGTYTFSNGTTIVRTNGGETTTFTQGGGNFTNGFVATSNIEFGWCSEEIVINSVSGDTASAQFVGFESETGNDCDNEVIGSQTTISISNASVYDGATGDADGGTASISETCEARNPGIGWILCAVMSFSVDVLDSLTITESTSEGEQGFLGNILNFNIADSEEEALRTVWSGFRVLANSLFAIVFLLVIYAAATGSGIGPYNLKRLLPRLIISAIAVQLSFDIAVFLVDFFNALGRGTSELMLAPLPTDLSSGITSSGFLGFLGNAALSALFLILVIIVAIGAIVGVLIMAAVFILRNMGLVILIVLAPLAFVLWTLPNTERIFRKWWEWFIQLLAIFPLAAMLLSSGKLIGFVWLGGTGGAGSDVTTVGEGPVGSALIATLAIFLPYYLAPRLFQFAGGIIGRLGNQVQNAKGAVENREFMQRGKAKAKRTAFRGLDATRVGLDKKVGESRNPNSSTRKMLSKALGSQTIDRYSARAERRFQQIQTEDIQASEVQLQAMEDRAKAKELRNPEQGKLVDGVRQPDQDKAAALELGRVLRADSSSTEQKVSAASRLANVYNGQEEASKALRETISSLQKSERPKDQEIYSKIMGQNIGTLSQVLPNTFKGDSKAVSGSTESVLKISGGGLKDIVRPDQQGGSREVTERLVERYNEAAINPSTREEIDLTKVKDLFDGLGKRSDALQMRQQLQQYYDFQLDPKDSEKVLSVRIRPEVEAAGGSVQPVDVQSRLSGYNVQGGQAPTVGDRLQNYQATRPPVQQPQPPQQTPETPPPPPPEDQDSQ